MKRLTLLRHAKSDWSDTTQRDFDRPLNDKGKRAAATIGQYLVREGFRCDKLLCSPAVRVKETLAALELPEGTFPDPVFEEKMYLASSATLRDVASLTDDSVVHLMMMGHNSGLEDLVLDMVPDNRDDALRETVFEKYPTATLATMEIDIERWADLERGGARLLTLVRPRDLDPTLGPEF